MHNRATLDATIRGRWPTPLALAWGSVAVAEGAHERLKRLTAFVEMLFRITAVVGLADYRSSDEIAPGNVKDHSHVECLLSGKIWRNFTLGDWHKLACGLTRACALREDGAFLREFAAWLDAPHESHENNERALGWLVKLRNDSGHGAMPESASVAERAAAEYETFLRDLLGGMTWWSGYRFMHVRSASAASAPGAFHGTLEVWAGNSSPVPRVVALWRGWLVPSEMYVFAPDGSRALRVSRLAKISSSTAIPTDRFFLFHKGLKRGGVVLQDDRCDERESEEIPQRKGAGDPAFSWLPRGDEAHVAIVDVEGRLAAASDADAPASRLVDEKYALHEVLGRGGSSTVYRATNMILEMDCAVKVLSHAYCADAVARERFVREARLMHQVSNRYVQRALDFGMLPDGRPYIATPIAEGGSLADVVASGPVEMERVRRWLAQALEGLCTLHAVGITHRDIKPANLLLHAGQICITDLGVAASVEHSNLTTQGTVVGTLAYMAPEQLRAGLATPAADIYALGVVAHELLLGARPEGRVGQGVPTAVGALIRGMTESDPEHRPSALEASRALQNPASVTPAAPALAESVSGASGVARGNALEPIGPGSAGDSGRSFAPFGEYASPADSDSAQTPALDAPDATLDVPGAAAAEGNNSWVWWVGGALVMALLKMCNAA